MYLQKNRVGSTWSLSATRRKRVDLNRIKKTKALIKQRFVNDEVNGQVRSFEFQDAITLESTIVRRDNGDPANNLNLDEHFGVEIVPGNAGAQPRVRVWTLGSMTQTLTHQVINQFYMPTPAHPLLLGGHAVTSQQALTDAITQLLLQNEPLIWRSPVDNVEREITGVATGNDLLNSPFERI